jgi:xanthine/CO dehydrogenase XdhC/CoxF family maturation factor
MLIAADGSYAGCLSGGCLEELIAEVGRRVIDAGRSELLHIDTRPHFGCPGQLDIWIEVLSSSAPDNSLLHAINERFSTRSTFQLSTVFSAIKSHGLGTGETTGTRLVGVDRVVSETADRLVQTVMPKPRLIVVGWTVDAEPLYRLAAVLGWETWRVVPSNEVLAEFRYEGVERTVCCSPEEVATHFEPDVRTAVVVMTHHLGRDSHYLRHLLPHAYGYLGMLGSRRRREIVLGEMGELGLLDDDTLSARFYAPMGLDIGADQPDSIALAIISEIHAVWQGQSAGFLRDRAGPLHPRTHLSLATG